MKKILNFSILFVIFGFILSGCGEPIAIKNINNSKYFEKRVAKIEIAKAIQMGAISKGWRTKTIRDGLLEANINVKGRYFVAVNINYTAKGYIITYKKSRNLKYNPKDNTIHPSYNKWIKILSENIDYELENIGIENIGVISTMKTSKKKKVYPKKRKKRYKKINNKINLKGKVIYIKPIIEFASKSKIANNIKQECTLSKSLSDDIIKYASKEGLRIVSKEHIRKNDIELKIQIKNAISAGNAITGHNKFIVISGAIIKGKTKYYSFDAARLSGGGYLGAYKSSCSVLGGITRRLGKDTVIWVLNPYDNAKLGDIRLIKK